MRNEKHRDLYASPSIFFRTTISRRMKRAGKAACVGSREMPTGFSGKT